MGSAKSRGIYLWGTATHKWMYGKHWPMHIFYTIVSSYTRILCVCTDLQLCCSSSWWNHCANVLNFFLFLSLLYEWQNTWSVSCWSLVKEMKEEIKTYKFLIFLGQPLLDLLHVGRSGPITFALVCITVKRSYIRCAPGYGLDSAASTDWTGGTNQPFYWLTDSIKVSGFRIQIASISFLK